MVVVRPLHPGQCAHCRLPLPAQPHCESVGDVTLQFCCVGCVLVYRVIGSTGEGGRADWFLAKLGLAALLSGNVMLFQSLSYFGTLDELGPEAARTSSWIMFACAIGTFVLLGVPMLQVATRGLRHGRLTLETLIGFGALAAIGYSAVETMIGGHHLYYDSGTMVLVFVTLGQYLDAEARRRALALLSPTLGSARRQARRYLDNEETLVDPDKIVAGAVVRVRVGEEIPVDGVVIAGSADIHEPLLTGEWRPRQVQVGDQVSAGSTSMDGALTLRASGAAETLAERVERYAIEARDRRAPIEATVDRVIAVFIPAVMLLSAACFVVWGLSDQWERGFQAALAVLVVACPCALGIATPMATTIALARAIGRGTLVRSGAVLEVLSRVKVMALDKTGTLTQGRPQVGAFRAAAGASAGVDESLRLAAGIELQVTHPFAHALVESVRKRGLTVPTASEVQVTGGGGAQGIVNGRQVAVGKPGWLASLGITVPAAHAEEGAGSAVAIAIDGVLAGELALDDPVRIEASAVMKTLTSLGISFQLLSGDRRVVVARVAEQIGVTDFHADLSPTDKPPALHTLRTAHGIVAMVGDGVNDAPALGTADVGIAFGPAADLARETADVAILREDLREIPRLLTLARRTFAIVRQNLVWAFSYNCVAIVIAAFGLLRPVFAAAAMVLSSVCVVGNSMRLSRPLV